MDAKTLAKIVQIVVQEEVGKIVRKEMATMKKQIVAEVRKSIPKQKPLNEFTPQDVQVNSLDDIVGNVLQQERAQQSPKKHLSNNSMVNEILNETVAFGGENPQDDYPTMGGSPMTSNSAPMGGNVQDFRAMMAEKMGMTPPAGGGNVSVQEMMPTTNTEGAPMRNQQVPDAVAKALTRDYTDLVKRMNK